MVARTTAWCVVCVCRLGLMGEEDRNGRNASFFTSISGQVLQLTDL